MPIDGYINFFYSHIEKSSFPAPNKENWERVRTEMLVHSDKANKDQIASLIVKKHPYEGEAQLNWRLDNFVAITSTSFSRAFNNLSRFMSDTVYGITCSERLMAILEQRIYGLNMTFKTYFQRLVLRFMIEDPNAALVWMPDVAENTDGRWIIRPHLISSKYITYKDADNLLFLSPTEKTMVRYRNGIVPEGEVYYWIHRGGIIRFYQYGDKIKQLFDWDEYATTDFSLAGPPFMVLGGVYKTEGYFDSFFGAFTVWGNEALRQYSDWQAVNALHAHPLKEITPDTCKTCKGKGWMMDKKNNCRTTCNTCRGRGVIINMGPFDAIVRPQPQMPNEPKDDNPMIRYIEPPKSIQTLWDSAMALLAKAEEALYLKYIEEAQSGVAKVIDRQEFINMLRDISSNFYDLMDFSLRTLAVYYNTEAPNLPAVNRPKSFGIKNEEELKSDFNAFIKTGRVKGLTVDTMKDMVYKMFPGDVESKKIITLIEYDPLFLDTVAEKIQLLSAGGTTTEELRNSTVSVTALERLIARRGEQWFKDTEDFNVILEELEAEVNDIRKNELSSDEMNFGANNPTEFMQMIAEALRNQQDAQQALQSENQNVEASPPQPNGLDL